MNNNLSIRRFSSQINPSTNAKRTHTPKQNVNFGATLQLTGGFLSAARDTFNGMKAQTTSTGNTFEHVMNALRGTFESETAVNGINGAVTLGITPDGALHCTYASFNTNLGIDRRVTPSALFRATNDRGSTVRLRRTPVNAQINPQLYPLFQCLRDLTRRIGDLRPTSEKFEQLTDTYRRREEL